MLALGEQAQAAVPERAPRAPPHLDERLGRDGEGMSAVDEPTGDGRRTRLYADPHSWAPLDP